MKLFLGFLVVCLTAVSAFVAPVPRDSPAAAREAAASTAMKDDLRRAAAMASSALLTAAPALATEGTGEVRRL